MTDPLGQIEEIIQKDVGGRGLARDPVSNLLTVTKGDFRRACESIASHSAPAVAVVTGFPIPRARPLAWETDGPLGAVFLARALASLGVTVAVLCEEPGANAVRIGLHESGLGNVVLALPICRLGKGWDTNFQEVWQRLAEKWMVLTHLIALERPGPSHTLESVRTKAGAIPEDFLAECPLDHQDRCHTMGGLDITDLVGPAHLLFEDAQARKPGIVSIGIGDGGNEIGMGKVPWEVIRRNVPRGGLVACRVPTDHLVVCGVSNWGAYGLGHGVRLLRGARADPALFNPTEEARLVRAMVERGKLVDGVTAERTATVDGLPLSTYLDVFEAIGKVEGPA